MALTGSTDEQKIWNYLFSKIENAYGTAGLMGNLYAESGLKSNNLQNNGNTKLGMTDAEFTAAFDKGSYSASTFVHDSYGYGLAQWTYYSRKQALLDYAKAAGTSIGDLEMQLGFLMKELAGYTKVMTALKNAKSVKEASDVVLLQYERPADQSDAVKAKRAGYGQTYYDKYASGGSSGTSTKGETTMTEAQLRNSVASFLNDYKGLTEGDARHQKLLAYFNNSGLCSRYKMTANDAWCATAVSATFIALGLAGNAGAGKLCEFVECSCYYMTQKAQTQGIWTENDAITPKVGDVIMYDWQDSGSGDNTGAPDHVGIVQSVSGSTMTIIEGNKSDTVGTRTLQVNGRYIRGYIQPNYSKFATTASAETAKESETESTNTSLAGTGIGTATALTAMNIRSTAYTTGKILSTIRKGTKVEVLQIESNGWYKIVWPGASCGYAYTSNASGKYYSYVANKTTASSGSVSKVQAAKCGPDKTLAGTYKTTAALNMRVDAGKTNAAGKTNEVILTIPNGATVQCYGYYSLDSNGVKWLYVVYNGKTGFCSSSYLKK